MAICRLISQAGNATFTGGGVALRIKTAIITTNATVGNRALLVNGTVVATKTVAASLTNQDLLDREVAVGPLGGGAQFSIQNGQAGDTVVVTTEESYA